MTYIIFLIVLIILINFGNKNFKKIENQSFGIQKKSKEFPNFKVALELIFKTQFILIHDNGNVIVYKMYETIGNRNVGEKWFILGVSDLEDSNYLKQIYKGFDGIEVKTENYKLNTKSDMPIEMYEYYINKTVYDICIDSRYNDSIMKIIYKNLNM